MEDSITLRPEQSSDDEFIFRLFASTRSDEVSALSWPRDEIERFLRSQLTLQTRHYKAHYPSTEFSVILQNENPIGRLYVERDPTFLMIHDIAVIPEARGKGIGTELLNKLLLEAKASNVPVRIYVEEHNPAMRLYERLKFEPVSHEGIYFLMECRC